MTLKPRTATIVILAVLLVLGLGGGYAAYRLVSNLRDLGASSPTQAVDGFLQAVLVKRDEKAALRYTCADSRGTAKIRERIDEVKALEERYRKVDVSWQGLVEEAIDGKRATVRADVRMSSASAAGTGAGSGTLRLRMTVVDESGWRVCEIASER